MNKENTKTFEERMKIALIQYSRNANSAKQQIRSLHNLVQIFKDVAKVVSIFLKITNKFEWIIYLKFFKF